MSHNCAPELIARCFAARTASHLAHLTTRSYAAHVALQGFYEGIIDPVDAFAECYQGVYGVFSGFPSVSVPKGELLPIKELRDWLASNREKAGRGQPELENLLDEITTVCDRAIYKLVNLK